MLRKLACRAAFLTAICVARTEWAAAAEPEAAVSRSLSFFVPVPPTEDVDSGTLVVTRLFVSRDAGANWHLAATQAGDVRRVAVDVQDDGHYWFAARRLTAAGQSFPVRPLSPELKVLVDTTPPQLAVSTQQTAEGRLFVSVESTDLALAPGTLDVRCLSADPLAKWEVVPVDPQSVTVDGGRMQATLPVPISTPFDLTIRVSVYDTVGYKAVAETVVHKTARPKGPVELTATESPAVPVALPAHDAGASVYPATPGVTTDAPPRYFPGTLTTPQPVATGSPTLGTLYQDDSVASVGRGTASQVVSQSGRVENPSHVAHASLRVPAEPDTKFPVASLAVPRPSLKPEPEAAAPATEADVELFEQLLARQPDNPRLREAFAELLTAQRDFHRAEHEWRAVLRLSPSNPTALRQLATCLTAQNRQVEARQLLQQSLDTP